MDLWNVFHTGIDIYNLLLGVILLRIFAIENGHDNGSRWRGADVKRKKKTTDVVNTI